VKDSPDERPSLVVAAEWTSRVTTVSLEMVLPGVVGLWIDRQLGTVMVFLILGVVLGMTVGMIHLVRWTSSMSTGKPGKKTSSEDQSES
jgi:F0F1-type ATP synthase assembly protein I